MNKNKNKIKATINKAIPTMAVAAMTIGSIAGGTTVFADGNTDTRTFTISAPAGDTHSYDVYQIFTGNLAQDGKTLSNLKAGQNYKGEGKESDVKAAADAIIAAAANAATDSDKLAEIEKYVNLTSAAVGEVSDGSALTGLKPGYYLIKDKDSGSVGDYDSYTLYVVKVANNITIERKVGVPTVDKKTKEVNDTAGSTSDWQNWGDYDIGDTVAFKLTGTIAANYDEYDSYKYIFHDTLDQGLAFDENSVVVKAGETTLSKETDYTISTSDGENGTKKIDVSFANLKAIKTATITKDTVITVEYNATLSDKAVLGSTGNHNEVKLEFSNNPNTGGEGSTSETPEKDVQVFTYKIAINKVDKDGEALNGAGFQLYKKVTTDGTASYEKVGDEITHKDSNVFEWTGIDAGDYKLVETTTPDGYNTIKDIEFTVSSTVTEDELTGLASTITTDNDNAVKNAAMAGDAGEGTVAADVINIGGVILPTTGTRGLIILGGGVALILGCAGIVRFKGNKKEEK